MKRTFLVILVFFLLCAGIVVSPQLLNINAIKNKVAAKVAEKTGWFIDNDRFQWRWMPMPHFILKDSSVAKEEINLTLPETRIYPLWRSLLKGSFELGRIVLIAPTLTMNDPDISESPVSVNLPATTVRIENGRISLPHKILAPDTSGEPPVILTEINGSLSLGKQIDFSLSSSSSISDIVEIEGTINTASNKFLVNYELVGLEIHKFIPSLLNDKLVPFRSRLNLRGQIRGTGTQQYTVTADGDFPCFTTPPDPDTLFLDCGKARFLVEKNSNGLLITINELNFKNPGVILSGRIGRILKDDTAENNEPLWLVDLTGKELDLTAIRKSVLTLWGDNDIAQQVCDIVKGGKARNASYYFKAPLDGFNEIKNMTIKAEADNAQILPPGTNLHLTNASGPIEISKGFLAGSGLSATLDKSRGENGSLLLDLSDDSDTFKLDLDIDADVSALPKVLIDLVQHKGFSKETGLFQNTQGRAKGHLVIGESLHDIKVNVQVDSMNVKTNNAHIPWPVSISSGKLTVSPDEVSWKDAKGSLGPHLVHKFSGSVNWAKEIVFSIHALDSSIDSNPFFHGLLKKGVIPEVISENLTNIEGPLQISNMRADGNFTDYSSWTYSLDISSNGSRWSSRHLPYPVFAENLSLKFTQKSFTTEHTKLWFLEQPVLIDGDLEHNNLANWRGWLKFNGIVRETFANWLKEKELFPEKYFPKLPCTLNDLKIEWEDKKLKIDGTIVAGMGRTDSPSVRIDLENNSEAFLIKELVVSSDNEIGKLNLKYSKSGSPDLRLKWQGFISASTVRKLLPTNIIRAEHVEGDFSLRLPFRRGKKPFTGWIKTSQYKRPDDEYAHGFTFKKLDISTNRDGSINIKPSLFTSVGNELELSGKVDIHEDQLDLDLDLKATKVNKDSIIRIMENLKGRDDKQAENEKKAENKPLQIRGRVDFMAERFESSSSTKNGMTSNTEQFGSRYVFSPIKGYVTFHPDNYYSVNLRSSKVCGLNISGSFYSDPSIGENSFTIYTESSSPPLLQETLPCFGIEQDVLEGPLHVDINVTGNNGKWTDGVANIYSEKGFIRRLGFLAKVFSVINLTDLFRKRTLPDATEGFTFSRFDIKSHIKENQVIIDNAILKGSGLNLFAEGTYDLGSHNADLIMMVAPLKSVDAIVTNIPLVGKIAGGADKALISIPVGIKGHLHNPDVTLLPPGAIGQGLINLITNTFSLPFTIFSPGVTNTSP